MVNPDIQETKLHEQKRHEQEAAELVADEPTVDKPVSDAQVVAEKSTATAKGDNAQNEMPFALVQGEPLTVVPQDLYIPPDALEVILEAFEGPLDL